MILNLVKTIKGVTLIRNIVNTFVFVFTGFPDWKFGSDSPRVRINTLTYATVPVHLVNYWSTICILLFLNTHTRVQTPIYTYTQTLNNGNSKLDNPDLFNNYFHLSNKIHYNIVVILGGGVNKRLKELSVKRNKETVQDDMSD